MVWLMPLCQFGERQYELAANLELLAGNGSFFTPTTSLEGALGIDVALTPGDPRVWLLLGVKPPRGVAVGPTSFRRWPKNAAASASPPFLVSLFVQYKRSTHLTRSNTTEWSTHNLPYWRVELAVVKAVCANCNGGWMSAIEANAKPILQDLIYAKGGVLDPDDQRKLATWAFLKACVFDELHPNERAVPAEHRRRLYTYKHPPAAGVAIWLGTYEALEVGHYAYQALKVGRDDLPAPEEPNIYIVTITAGTLIVQVAGSLLPELAFDDLDLPTELHVAKIWPANNENVEFAQDRVMNHDTLVGFTKMLYNVMGRLTGGAPPAR
jgi:hypothetical protein